MSIFNLNQLRFTVESKDKILQCGVSIDASNRKTDNFCATAKSINLFQQLLIKVTRKRSKENNFQNNGDKSQ